MEDNKGPVDKSLESKDGNKLDSKIDYQALEQQRTEALQAQLKAQLRRMEAGKSDSLRRAVLRFVVEGKYREATSIIDEYLQMKNHYSALSERCRIHVNHSKELINAIRAKRNFPKLSQLSMSKQQEILDRALKHFDELKQTVRSIETIVRDEAVKDIRSTAWLLRTAVYVTAAVAATAFASDFSQSVGQPFWAVFTDYADRSYKFLATLIPFL